MRQLNQPYFIKYPLQSKIIGQQKKFNFNFNFYRAIAAFFLILNLKRIELIHFYNQVNYNSKMKRKKNTATKLLLHTFIKKNTATKF